MTDNDARAVAEFCGHMVRYLMDGMLTRGTHSPAVACLIRQCNRGGTEVLVTAQWLSTAECTPLELHRVFHVAMITGLALGPDVAAEFETGQMLREIERATL